MIGYGALTIFAVSLGQRGVHPHRSASPRIVPVMVVVMLAGVPASGGGLSIYMVPEFFRPLAGRPAAAGGGRHRPLAASTSTASASGGNLLVLAIWGAVGLALNLLVVDPLGQPRLGAPARPDGPAVHPRASEEVGADSDGDDTDARPGDPALEPAGV